MRIKVKDKKRLGKNYWLNCDPYCYWISEEYEVKKGKTAGTIAERNVSGYTATFEQAVNSFIEKGIKAAEIDDFTNHEAFGVIDEEVREVIGEVGLIAANCTEFRDATYKDSVFDTKANAILRIKIAAVKCACEAVQVAAMCEKWVMSNEKDKD